MSAEKERPKADETEITPEMIEAGLEQLSLYDPSEDCEMMAREIVVSIFEAMLSASSLVVPKRQSLDK